MSCSSIYCSCSCIDHHSLTADIDYVTVDEPIIIRSSSNNRVCVGVIIIEDSVAGEFYEVFLVRLTRISTSIFADQVVVVILDEG